MPGGILQMDGRPGNASKTIRQLVRVTIFFPLRKIYMHLSRAAPAFHFPLNERFMGGCMRMVLAAVGDTVMQSYGIPIMTTAAQWVARASSELVGQMADPIRVPSLNPGTSQN